MRHAFLAWVLAALLTLSAVLAAPPAAVRAGDLQAQVSPGPGSIVLKHTALAVSTSGATLNVNFSMAVADYVVVGVFEQTGGPAITVTTNAGETWSNHTACSGGVSGEIDAFMGKVRFSATVLTLTPGFSGPFAAAILSYTGVDYPVGLIGHNAVSVCVGTTGSSSVSMTSLQVPSLRSRPVLFWGVEANVNGSIALSGSVTREAAEVNLGIAWTLVASDINETTIPTSPSSILSWIGGSHAASGFYVSLVPTRALAVISAYTKGSSGSGTILIGNAQLAPSYEDGSTSTNCWRSTDVLVIFLTLSASTSIDWTGTSGMGTPRTILAASGLLPDYIFIAAMTGGCGSVAVQVNLGTTRVYNIGVEAFRNSKLPFPEGDSIVENAVPHPAEFSVALNATRPSDLMAAQLAYQSSSTVTNTVGQMVGSAISPEATGLGFSQPASNLVANWSATVSGGPGNVDMLAVVIGAEYYDAILVDFTWSLGSTFSGWEAAFTSSVSGSVGAVNYSWDFDTNHNPGVNTSFQANPVRDFPALAQTYDVRLNVTDTSGNTGSVTHALALGGGATLQIAGWAFWLLLFFGILAAGVVASWKIRKKVL